MFVQTKVSRLAVGAGENVFEGQNLCSFDDNHDASKAAGKHKNCQGFIECLFLRVSSSAVTRPCDEQSLQFAGVGCVPFSISSGANKGR